MTTRRITCPVCGRSVALTSWGIIRHHGWRLLRINRTTGEKKWSDVCAGSLERIGS